MRITLSALIALLCLTSCGALVKGSESLTRDSVRVEIRTNTVFVSDTVTVEIPREIVKEKTRDTVSHLETDYAISDASISGDGYLSHSLETKLQKRLIPVSVPHVTRDSIVFRDRDVNKTVTVEVERDLTWWQQTQIYGFWGLLLLLAIIYRKQIVALVRLII